MQLAVGRECLFFLAALDQGTRGQIAGVLGLRLERAEPALVLAARRSDAATLIHGDRAIGEKTLHAGRVDDRQEPVGHRIVVRDHDILGPLAGGPGHHFAGNVERLQRLALRVLDFERHAEAVGGGLHALCGGHPVNFIRPSRIDERDGLRTGNGAAQQNG
jgi:hypothetical protein